MKKYFSAITLLVVFLFHLSYINNGFIWLDHGDIERGRAIIPLSEIGSAFVTRFGQTGFYRPIVTVFNAIDFAVYGFWAPGFHLTNILLHVAVSFAAILFVSSFFQISAFEKILIILFTGLNPIGLLPVGVISYRQELLVALFIYLSIYFYSRSRCDRKPVFKWYFLFSYLSALMSKETALFLVPALLLFWEALALKNKNKSNIIFGLSGWALVTFAYIGLRIAAVPEIWHSTSPSISFSEAIGTRIVSVSMLAWQMLLPTVPKLSDAVTVVPLNDPFVMMIIFVLLAISGLALRKRISRENLTISVLFLILLFPAFNIVPLPRFYSPHYGYLMIPVIGVAFVLLIRHINKSLGILLCSVWLIIAAFSTFRSGFKFNNDLVLFLPEVENDARFLEGHQYLGDYFFRQQKWDIAESHYLSALNNNPKFIAFVDETPVMNNLAGVYLFQNKLDEADGLLVKLSEKKESKDNQLILYNRAVIAEKKEDWQKVIELLNRSDIKWGRPEPLLLLQKAREMSGNSVTVGP